MQNITLLGATGSIGTQVLDIIRANHDQFKLVSIAYGKNTTKAIEIIDEFNPDFICAEKDEDCKYLSSLYPNKTFAYGDKGLIEAAVYDKKPGVLVNAVVGMVGLMPTIYAIKAKKTILLANKETLVVAGKIISDLVKEYKVKMLPIDSEHSAVLQCLSNHNLDEIEKIIITASGGAFRDKSRDELENVSINDALGHPNWKMGSKITVDCATMVNKGLEVIEAHFLFNMPYDKIATVLHRESIVHSLVEFKDNSVMAQMAQPDMRIPIQYALTYPKKINYNLSQKIDLTKSLTLTFKEMDLKRYPMLNLAYKVGKLGGIMPAIYNASNEEAVKLFIDGKIKFLEIEKIITDAVEMTQNISNPSIEEILEASMKIKNKIKTKYL